MCKITLESKQYYFWTTPIHGNIIFHWHLLFCYIPSKLKTIKLVAKLCLLPLPLFTSDMSLSLDELLCL